MGYQRINGNLTIEVSTITLNLKLGKLLGDIWMTILGAPDACVWKAKAVTSKGDPHLAPGLKVQ